MVLVSSHLSVESGPLPSPEVLARHGKTDPRFVDAILEGFVSERQHRRESERRDADADRTFHDRGQKMGVAVATAALVISGVVGVFGSPVAAAVIVSVGVGAPVVASFSGRRRSPPSSS